MRASIVSSAVCLLLSISGSNGFSIVLPRQTITNTQRFPVFFSKQQDDNTADDDDDKWDNYNPIRQEQSKMPDFIASYMDRNKEKEAVDDTTSPTTYTHMIGVPMDDCHELLLELESVQRAILYHCPLLVHACIVPAVTRMPLLYVSAPRQSVATVTATLHDIVHRVVQQQLYVKQAPTPIDSDNEDQVMGSINSEGYKPLVLSFQNLEIDGQGNQCLSTVAMQDEGTARLSHLVDTLKTEIESLGWKVSIPPDDYSHSFRPRVPFMRLPHNFKQLLDPLEDGQEDWMRTSDQGGNGISPIFWCQWWEDVMAKHVRLREISVYPRQPTVPVAGLGEQAFYMPHETTTLPKGNNVLAKAEARHRAYSDERMAKAQGRTLKENKDEEDTLRDYQVHKERERLESIYAADGASDAALIDDNVKKESQEFIEAINVVSSVEDTSLDVSPRDDSRKGGSSDQKQIELDEWTKERIRKTVEARAFVQAQKVKHKDKPSIEDNEVFQKYKNNTLVDKTASDVAKALKTKLPDYPSREHFVGIWRVVTSPTGFPEDAGEDTTKSDNIILRVDGTIAGGPTLDRETNQKAAGGTWKTIEATDDDATKLRIRLVIPPKKERILVMEGEVTRFMTGPEMMPLTKSTFGIPELEAAAQKLDKDMEDLIHCGGDVWIEDAVTGKNRDEIGTFSLMKLQSPMEPGKYTITIPRPVRSQD